MSQGSKRNSECPCGSGKKFKHCHGRQTSSQSSIPLLAGAIALLSVVLLVVLWPGSESRALSSNPAPVEQTTHYDSIPGLDLSNLERSRRLQFVSHLNHSDCICECGMTLAECRNIDPGCDHSKDIVEELYAQVSQSAVEYPAANH